MAEGYLKHKLKVLGKKDKVMVNSAGTYAVQGEVSPINAKRAIEKYGADISNHSATTLENSNIENADFILVMTEKHKRDVIARFPKLKEKVKLLGEYSNDKDYLEIDDPWGYSFNVYEKCAKEIVNSVDEFIKAEV